MQPCKMLRHYFISDSLDDLEKFEDELEARGVATQQIHVLSLDDPNVSGTVTFTQCIPF